MSHNDAELKERLEEALAAACSEADVYNKTLWEAMQYSLMAGGKRVRPMLLLHTGLSLGASEEDLMPFAVALEMVHTYSLIHDDLPAMDNDDYRRGRLTNHKVYGEATAILAGDGLQCLAFELMGKAVIGCGQGESDKAAHMAQALTYLARSAGPSGMVGGQMADLNSESRTIALEELSYIEYHKTCRLLMAAFCCGGYLAGASEAQIKDLEEAGTSLGKAFQIWDDVLDVEGNLEELGKTPHKDAAAEKATFVSCYGLEKAKEEAARQTDEALQKLAFLPGEHGKAARDLAASLLGRKN